MRFKVVFDTKHGESETFIIEANSIIDIVTSKTLGNDPWPINKIELIEEDDDDETSEYESK